MSKLLNKIFSMQIGAILLLLFALSCAVATFIENDFGTESAFALIYGSWWFGFIQLWLVVLIIYNMFRYDLFKIEKLPALVFHISFLLILVGAGLTRYVGFEGTIHIREGQTQNIMNSSESYVQIKTMKNDKIYSKSEPKLFSYVGGNSFNMSLDIDGKNATFEYEKIVPNAVQKVVESKNDKPIISLMLSQKGERPFEIVLNEGEEKQAGNLHVKFLSPSQKIDKSKKNYFYVSLDKDKFYLTSDKEISWYKMSDNTKGEYKANTQIHFKKKQLYGIDDINIVPKALLKSGKLDFVSQEQHKEKTRQVALVGKFSYDGKSKQVGLIGFGKGTRGIEKTVDISGQKFLLSWGSKLYELPFSLELMDFQLDRYPGSHSPSSYASEVKVIDKKNNIDMPYRIYMNHVLDYGGFRFFQSSYDRDEKGTILSINKDPGKWPTYIGYALLFLGLIFNIINQKSRFRQLAHSINKASLTKLCVILTLALLTNASNVNASTLPQYDKKHSDLFGTILTQSIDGRIKPLDTLSNEVLSKVYRKSSLDNQNANQVLLGMLTNPALWQKVPMIKVHEDSVKKLLGINPKAKYAAFDDFFEKGNDKRYKLIKYIEEAKRKKPALRDRFDKEIIKVDERLNICYLVYTGDLLRIFPQIDDKNKSWYSPNAALTYFSRGESTHIQHMLQSYFNSLKEGLKSGDWKKADEAVNTIKSYQRQYANDIIPSDGRIKMELKFNHFKIFEKLTPVYLLAGFILLFAIFFKMIFPSINIKIVNIMALGVLFFAFLAHTAGLGMRWYISGHAPWSDSYESMIYIAWALAFSGVTFSRKSPISLALTAILSGISLFVAHLAWMDPQITNLVPVLKSYWLTIHVSVITASYGFLGLCALLGFFTLILFIIVNPKKDNNRNKEIKRNITEATRINEMAMILGLSLLTIGNFLGGIWANESWGRYWGWDAKETWALISILIYSAVVHLKLIPKINNQYYFAVFSMFSYWSIIMTYFGVNFYLSGMHSYAAGDPVPIPTFVPVIALIMLALSVLAYFKRKVAQAL